MLFRRISLLILFLFFTSFILPLFYINNQRRTVVIEAGSSQTYGANKDAYINGNYIYDNYGWERYLWVAGGSSGLGSRRTFIQFSLKNIPTNAIILSAKLRLYVLEVNYASSKYLYFDRITGSWKEWEICWVNQPAVTTSHRVKKRGPGSGGIWWEVPVTSQVIDALNEWDGTGSPTYGVRVILQWESLTATTIKFYSRESIYGPELVVEYIENNPPSAPTLTIPVANQHFDPTSQILFSWIFNDPDSGDSQSAYRFQLDDNSDFSSPIIDTGKVTSSESSTTQTLPSTVGLYYWRVKTWDSQDVGSDWSEARSIIVDRIKIIAGGVVNFTVDVDVGGKIWYSAVYEYDNSAFDDSCGVLYINGFEMTWDGQKWVYTFPYSTEGNQITFHITGVLDNQYGLTEINNQAGDITINWATMTVEIKK